MPGKQLSGAIPQLQGDCVRPTYRRVFCSAASLFSIMILGCGGGGSSTVLSASGNSLPNGTVGTPYSATLVATGGSPNYTWSQTSGGAMPSGVSLGSSGVFVGTPTAAGTFGPYVFTVTDSTGATAATPSVSITVTAGTLTVTTSSLPAATINTAYSATLAATGGTPPYTWTETSGGALPVGIANITSAGVLAGTPTATGNYGPYVFTVTDSTGATAASSGMSFVVGLPVCQPGGNESALNAATPYAFLVQGTDATGNPIDIAGSFTPNGNGGISKATVDYNGPTNGPAQLQVDVAASSYSFSSSTFGCLALAFTGQVEGATAPSHGESPRAIAGAAVRAMNAKPKATATAALSSVQFAFTLGGFDGKVYHTGRLIESDTAGSGTVATGLLHVQSPGAFSLSSLAANYAFGLSGWTTVSGGYARTALAGSFANASGAISAGYADLNAGGVASGELTGGSGTIASSIDTSTGRGTGAFSIPTAGGNLSFDFAFYVLNGSDIVLLSTDSTAAAGSAPLLAGRALASSASYAAGALNGYYILGAQGLETSGSTGNYALIGTLNATNAGTLPQATLYVNDAGTYSATPYANGTYTTEAATGRVSIAGLTATPPVIYLTAAASDEGIAGFVAGSDTQSSSGVLCSSPNAPNEGVSSLLGKYAASTQEDIDGKNGVVLGSFSFPGTGQYLATMLSVGTVPNLPGSGPIAINPEGSGSLNSGSFPFVTNGSVLFAIPSSGDPLLYVLTTGTGSN